MSGDGSLTAVDGVQPRVAFSFRRADGQVLAEHEPGETFIPASTLKLAVLVAIVRELEAGRADLEETWPAEHTWPSQVDGEPFGFDADEVDPGMPAAGTPMPLRQVLDRMITVSSNEATNMVMARVGLDAIAAVLADAGCTGSALGRLYGDIAAYRAFGRVSYVTAGDLARLMCAVVSSELTGPRWTAYLTDLLQRQQDAVIGAVAAPGVPWGSKSGWVQGIRHDVAFIGEPGPQCRVLAVCTRDFPDHPSAVAAIRAVARALLG